MISTCTPADQIPVALEPRAWRNTRWVGSIAGHATTPDLLAGAFLGADHQHAITRTYAAACADLAQATLGGAAPGSASWDRWFAALRSAARELSPAHGNQHVIQRALFHGGRLEGTDTSWVRQLRRGFSALLAASLPEPVPALVGEDVAMFRSADEAWLARQSLGRSDAAPSEQTNLLGDTCSSRGEAARWPTASLRPNPLNPRSRLDPADIDELAASIVGPRGARRHSPATSGDPGRHGSGRPSTPRRCSPRRVGRCAGRRPLAVADRAARDSVDRKPTAVRLEPDRRGPRVR